MTVSETGLEYLKQTADWTKFMAVLGFISLGMMIFSGGILATLSGILPSGNELSYAYNDLGENGMMITGILYVVLGAVMIIPYAYLNKFSNICRNSIRNQEEQLLEESFYFMKSYWKFLGIFTIVIISLVLIAVPVLFLFLMF
jgi:hypothetical protein